jgi:ubiquinol-cytochrome c reductase cytochrome b subunit
LGKPPDPTIIGASPKPDWFLLWYYALLSVAPRWTENPLILLGPLIFGMLLIFLPFVANKGERSPLRRPWSIVIVAAIVIIIAYFGNLGRLAPWSPRLQAEPLPATIVGVPSGPIANGATVFYEKGCEYCHKIDGYGGIRGPDLTYVGDRMSAEQIKTRIFSGATNMPSYNGNMSEDQLSSLLAFLESRRRRPIAEGRRP